METATGSDSKVFEMRVAKTYGGGTRRFRLMTLSEARELPRGSRQWFKLSHLHALDGTARQLTVTSVKTWKTRSNVEVRVKYDLYEYATLNDNDITSLLLVPVYSVEG